TAAAQPAERAGIAVVAIGDEARTHAVAIVAALRQKADAPPVTMEYSEIAMTTHFKRADRANARAALIIGADELRERRLTWRDLLVRNQESFPESATPAQTARDILERYHHMHEAVTA
ncbi:MAG TPA: His/Gly/Thr/Pro-type tRNA ligase C-terminal domain-containing protein, partial [Candidatus Baltobacteraceae bacterium]